MLNYDTWEHLLIDKLLLSCWATGNDVADQYKIQQQKN